jgi:prepilin-type processing-associated H-X9-DG protein
MNVTPSEVSDGLSNTKFVAEKALTTRTRAYTGTIVRTENCAWVVGTGIATAFIAEFGPNVFEYDAKHDVWTESATSQHPGGVNVLMGDGSVRFVKNSVDATNVAGKPFGVWQRLAARNDGTPIESGSY